jgi:hypothetical protein
MSRESNVIIGQHELTTAADFGVVTRLYYTSVWYSLGHVGLVRTVSSMLICAL